MRMQLLLISSMLSFSMGIAVTPPEPAESNRKLFLITITQELVEGKYYSEDLGGIHFISQDGGVSITVLGDEGIEEPLFIASRPSGPNTASIASILGHQFLLLNTTDEGLVDYVINPSMLSRAKTAVNSPNPRKLEQLLPKLSRDTSSNRENAFTQLLSQEEVQLVVAAAIAMGEQGITGVQYPAALPFYMTALRFAGQSLGGEMELPSAPSKRQVRSSLWLWPWPRRERCHHGYKCRVGRCPRRRSYNRCYGLCGPQCTCWWWVCRDCCYNWSCATHDRICHTSGRDSWQCWLTAPIALLCL